MKRWLLGSFAFALALPVLAEGVEWFTSLQTALEKAQAEDKIVLLDFTGSDWCVWCQRLKGEIFDTPEFATFAKANLVMVEVDFPNRNQLSAEQQAANDSLAQKFGIRGYPTLILLDRWGKQVGKGGYVRGGPKPFIDLLEKVPGIKHVDLAAKSPSVSAKAAASSVKGAAPATPPAPRGPEYGDLTLKGISGAGNQRLAILNNQTFATGETARVKVRDTRVEVTCKQILENSVVVVVDGREIELKLKSEQAAKAN